MSSDERNDIVALFQEGRIVASGIDTTVFNAGGNVAIIVRVPDLKYIEFVMHYEFLTNPIVDPGNPTNRRIRGNVVGFTLVGLGGGTTLTTMVICSGM